MGSDDFDEAAYLRANPDVAVMVERGLFRSPLDHWQRAGSLEHSAGRRRSGFYEHDLVYDEETYLRLNADVVALVRRRALGSGYEHWMRHGRIEFSRGRRHAPFVASTQPFRPFRLTVGDAGGLLVGAVDAEPEPGVALTLRHAEDPEIGVAAGTVACSPSLDVQDVMRRKRPVRLLVVRYPAFASDARRPRPLVLRAGATSFLTSRDAGMQAFFFAGVRDARDFLETGLRVAETDAATAAAFTDALVALVLARLQPPIDPREPFAGFFLESLSRRPGEGFDAGGWFAPASAEVTRVSVFCPETAECAELSALSRIARPDVLETLRDTPGVPADASLGFAGFLPLPRASAITPARLVFEVTLSNGVARFFESRDVSKLL
ncbi:MAG TPA: hypothetical protein VHC69_23205 [Polyangiaceae bacterium]|nr:hypothetical protein [Polyangiaceae bacterium]